MAVISTPHEYCNPGLGALLVASSRGPEKYICLALPIIQDFEFWDPQGTGTLAGS